MKYMTKWILTLMLPIAGFLAGPAHALDFESNFNDDEHQSIQAEIILDNEGGDNDVEFTGQFGFGVGWGPLDELGFYVGHQDGNGGDLTTAAFWIEENFIIDSPYVPYLGTDFGYGKLLNNSAAGDTDAFYFRINAGVKYFIQKNMAVKASIKAAWATEKIYLIDGDKTSGKDYGISIGLHYYY